MSLLRIRAGDLGRILACVCTVLLNSVYGAEFPRFEMREIDAHVGEVCYAVTSADVDGDKKPDVVAVTENRVVWFQNPDWKLRVITADTTDRDNVCIAPHDIDGDGKIDFALGAGWLNNRHLGTIQWLSRGKSLDEPWHVHPIGREGWTHRVRFGDIMGIGTPQLIVSPLNKTQGLGVRVLAYEIPKKPASEPWEVSVLDDSLNAMHNHWTGDLDGDKKTDLITASMEGVFLFQRDKSGKLLKTQIGEGAPGPAEPQKSGAGEIKVGRMKNGSAFIATVEPMHGNQIAVYTPPGADGTGKWKRHLLDSTLGRGHAVGVGDIDHDGTDELIIGHSDKGTGNPSGPGVFIYDLTDETGSKWTKHAIDNGGIATEDLVVDDFNGDGWPDIAAGGRATHNVKLYFNLGGGK